jgi:hypothetical protein
METKKNYKKPEFVEVEMKMANVVMGSPCTCDAGGTSDTSM